MREKISFDEYIEKFRSGEMHIDDWNFCKSRNNQYDVDRGLGNATAYVVGQNNV